jgi:hypothetical protein
MNKKLLHTAGCALILVIASVVAMAVIVNSVGLDTSTGSYVNSSEYAAIEHYIVIKAVTLGDNNTTVFINLGGSEGGAVQNISSLQYSPAINIDHYIVIKAVTLGDNDTFLYTNLGGSLQNTSGLPFFPVINSSLKAVFIDSQSFGIDGCCGSYGRTIGLYNIPWIGNNITISKIDSTGTAYITYHGSNIILNQGDSWQSIISNISTIQLDGRPVEANITISDSLKNYGIIEKQN